MGEGEGVGVRGGGGGARSALKERGPGPKAPGPALLFGRPGAARRAAPGRQTPPPPRAVAVFCRPNEPSATPFLPRLPTNKTSPPLPMSGGPANSAGKPKTFSSWFSPAFFKSGRGLGGRAPNGVQGQSPWRSPGAAPHTSRGIAPEKAPEEPTRHPSAGRDWARRRRAGKSPWG